MNPIPKHPKKILSASHAISQVPPTSVEQSSGVVPNDYFHTGAGARYLRRAEGPIVTQTLRGNVSVLMGSGANIVVLSRFWNPKSGASANFAVLATRAL